MGDLLRYCARLRAPDDPNLVFLQSALCSDITPCYSYSLDVITPELSFKQGYIPVFPLFTCLLC